MKNYALRPVASDDRNLCVLRQYVSESIQSHACEPILLQLSLNQQDKLLILLDHRIHDIHLIIHLFA